MNHAPMLLQATLDDGPDGSPVCLEQVAEMPGGIRTLHATRSPASGAPAWFLVAGDESGHTQVLYVQPPSSSDV